MLTLDRMNYLMQCPITLDRQHANIVEQDSRDAYIVEQNSRGAIIFTDDRSKRLRTDWHTVETIIMHREGKFSTVEGENSINLDAPTIVEPSPDIAEANLRLASTNRRSSQSPNPTRLDERESEKYAKLKKRMEAIAEMQKSIASQLRLHEEIAVLANLLPLKLGTDVQANIEAIDDAIGYLQLAILCIKDVGNK